MKIYEVGGAVRDSLLGLPVKDRDYVVIGSSQEEMLAAGFLQVGKDFPVFLHPETHEEYALARTEKKTGPGYKGFAFHTESHITLEEDLLRRDLTINAMARSIDGKIIDPFGGQKDLKDGILRHVSQAFTEDPVRILRVSRFAARYGFHVAEETKAFITQMVQAGYVKDLMAERVWQEISRGLMEKKPSLMFTVLKECGALQELLPELHKLYGVPQTAVYHPEIDTFIHVMMAVDYSGKKGYALPIRFAVLCHDFGKGVTDPLLWPKHHGHESVGVPLVESLCERLRIPNECRDLAVLTAREHSCVHRALEMKSSSLVDFFIRNDVFRKQKRFFDFLLAAECDHFGRAGFEEAPIPQTDFLRTMFYEAQKVKGEEIACQYADRPEQIPAAIRLARIKAVKDLARKQKTEVQSQPLPDEKL